MKMNKKILIPLIIILLIGVVVGIKVIKNVSTIESYDLFEKSNQIHLTGGETPSEPSQDLKDYILNNSKDKNDFVELIDNDGNNLIEYSTTYRLKNPLIFSESQKTKLDLSFDLIKQAGDLEKVEYQYENIEEYLIKIPTYKETCYPYNKTTEEIIHNFENKTSVTIPATTTYIENCTNIIISEEEETRYKHTWKLSNIDEIKNIYSNLNIDEYLDIKITGRRSQCGIGGYACENKIDNIINFATFSYPEYAWWNSSWANCKEVTVIGGASTLNDFRVFLNVSYDSDMQIDFEDLRFVNGTCSFSGSESNYDIDNKVNSNFAEIWVTNPNLETGINSMAMYYNNPTAPAGEDSNETWSNVIGAYHFEGVATDSSPNQEHFNVTGTIYNATGVIGQGITFNGYSDYLQLEDGNISKAGTTGYTVEGWMYHNDTRDPGVTTHIGELLCINYYGDDRVPLYIHAPMGGTRHMYAWRNPATSGTVGSVGVLSKTLMSPYKWYHFAVTFEENKFFRIYINGTLEGYNTSALTGGVISSNTVTLSVQADSAPLHCSGDSLYFGGGMDEIRIHNVSLSTDEVVRIYENSNYSKFSFGSEESAFGVPNVVPIVPLNNLQLTNHTVTFIYNVTESQNNSINNCSLWIDDNLNNIFIKNETDTSITRNINQTFLKTFGNIHFLDWKISCWNNKSIQANSSTRRLLINNAPTTPTQNYPTNNTLFSGSIELNCSSSTDSDGDTIFYQFWGDESLLQNTTSTIYTWTIGTGNHYWKCRSHDNFNFSSYTSTRTISDMSNAIEVSYNCTAGFTQAMYYDFENENNFTSINTSIDYNLVFGLGTTGNSTIHGSIDNIDHFSICINTSIATNYSINYGEIEYEQPGHILRRYYLFEGDRLTSTPINDTLFLLPNADATSFLFEFVSASLTPYENKYTSLLRWYPELDTYDSVEMAKTDNKGQTIMRVVTEDVDYRIGLYETDGTLIKLLDPIRFACLSSPCSYRAIIKEEALDYTSIYGIVHNNIEYSGGLFTFIYNDPSQATSEMNMTVYKITGTSNIFLCSDQATGYTGVLTCNVSTYSGTFEATAWRTASPSEPLAKIIVSTVSTVFNSTIGLFISFIIFIVLVLVGLVSPVLTIVFGIIGLIPATVFGAITLQVFLLIAIIGGIVIHMMKRVSK